MFKFTFNIIRRDEDFRMIENFDEWISAKDKFDAQSVIEQAYPVDKGYVCRLIKIE